VPDIFLSYSREDAAIAQTHRDAFAREGLSVWWDATLRSGEAYDQVTETALRGARAVVVLWSPRSVASRWVRAEATIAARNQTLMPVTIEPCERPVMFELTQTADLSHWRGAAEDKAWLAFLGDVRRMVGRGPAGPVEPSAAFAHAPTNAGSGIPVVAVLPIAHRAGDDEMEVLAEDLSEDITRELSQGSYCKVIAASTMAAWRGQPIDHRTLRRELEARYLVEGKLQQTGGNARLTLQLIDTASDSMLWSSRATRKLADIAASPEEFPASVAAELSQAVGQLETRQALAKSGSCSAWEYVLRAQAFMTRQGSDRMRSAEAEARSAVAAAPDFGLAHATLASALAARVPNSWGALGDAEHRELVREVHSHIRRAIQLDGDDPATLIQLAFAYATLKDGEAGLRLALRATELAPHSPEAQAALGSSYFQLGKTADALTAFRTQLRLASQDVSRPFALALLGVCLFDQGRTAEAEEAIDRSLALHPDNYAALRWKAIVAAELGKEQAARAAVGLLRANEPGKSTGEYLQLLDRQPVGLNRKHEAIAILRRLLEESEGDA
jgi:TolB-like protein/cytochrome c-type biogenesis protein CcmH/NrfG